MIYTKSDHALAMPFEAGEIAYAHLTPLDAQEIVEGALSLARGGDIVKQPGVLTYSQLVETVIQYDDKAFQARKTADDGQVMHRGEFLELDEPIISIPVNAAGLIWQLERALHEQQTSADRAAERKASATPIEGEVRYFHRAIASRSSDLSPTPA